MGDPQRLAGILLDHQDADAGLVHGDHPLEYLAHIDRRQACGRLVEQQQRRLGHQRPAEGDHLALAAGQFAGLLAALLLQRREQGIDLVDDVAEIVAPDESAHFQIFVHGERREDAALLGHIGHPLADQFVGLATADILAPEPDLSLAQPDQAEDRLHCCRFAGAVRADDGDDLAGRHRQVDAFEDVGAAVAAGHAFRQ